MVIENFVLEGPAGRLECLLKSPPGRPEAAAVVCHPHPVFGGNMHNKVVHAVAGAIAGAGLPVLRFNFRGVGLSAGRYDSGAGERDDVRAVLDHVAGRYPAVPLLVAGYSFGAFVGLSAGCRDGRVASLIGIGVPVSLYDFSFLGRCGAPVSIIQGDQDRFGPLPLVLALAAHAPRGMSVVPVAGASHGFDGRLDALAQRVEAAIPAALRPSDPRPAPA